MDTLVPLHPPSASPYQYKPLPSHNSFRLLRLLPPRGDGRIECSLLIADLPFNDVSISYEAISYVWGNPNNNVDIICDGCTLAITTSLENVLRRVRLATNTRILWADGICINQDDVQERTSQVQVMALIYLRARRVLAWIGYGAGAGTASRLIKKSRKVFEDALEEKEDLNLLEVMDAQDQADLEFVVQMFGAPLFSRVWIIQELGVASEVKFLYGDFDIDWVDLVFFVNCMNRSLDLYELEHHTDYEKFYSAFISFREGFHKDEQLPDFLEILLMGRNYGASDPRDHVFALLGHPSAHIDGSPMTRADYAMPLSHVLTQLTFQLCVESESLRPLSAVHHDKLCLSNSFPSWVPALHKASLVGPFGVDEKSYYAADSAIEDVDMFRRISDGVLTVRGLVFDIVSSFSSPSFPDGTVSTELERMQAFREAFALSQSQVQVAYETGKRLEAFGLTMTAGLFESSAAEDRIEQYRANFSAYFIKFYEMQKNTRRKGALGLDTKLVADIKEEAMNGKEYIFTRDANATWSGRKFFCTGRGFFGLGPKVLRKNDICCVLFGARVPFILRKRGDHYLLVGECYIHGIMRGEAIDMWRNGKLQLQEFELH